MPGWVLRCSFVAAALLPLLLGAPAALVLWLLMPLAVECSRVAEEHYFCMAGIVLLAGVCCLTLPEDYYALSFLWGGAGVGMLLSRQPKGFERSLIWAGLSAGMLCAALAWLGSLYQGDIFAGLAGEIAELLQQHERSGELLLRCYQLGFSRLEDELAAAVNVLGTLALTEEVKLQLLYSLRTTLETSLGLMMPQGIAAWLVLTLLLTTAVPDALRRKRGQKGILPPFAAWMLTRKAHAHLNALIMVYLLSLLAGSPVLATMGRLCAATFQYAYMILGLAVLEGVSKQHGMKRFIRRLWMAACILFAPFVLLILGVMDRVFDMRHLRRLTDDKGGNQQ